MSQNIMLILCQDKKIVNKLLKLMKHRLHIRILLAKLMNLNQPFSPPHTNSFLFMHLFQVLYVYSEQINL